jgi:MarR family transcriptional regulator, organic hydroperoxide resistance regulator
MLKRQVASRGERAEILERLEQGVRRMLAGAILFNQKVADELGLNATDLQCLNLLELQGSLTPGELARCCGLTTGGATVVLDRLEQAGYIRREANPRDRRSLLIRPVPARLRELQKIYRSKSRSLAQALAPYSQRELELILDFVTRTITVDKPQS